MEYHVTLVSVIAAPDCTFISKIKMHSFTNFEIAKVWDVSFGWIQNCLSKYDFKPNIAKWGLTSLWYCFRFIRTRDRFHGNKCPFQCVKSKSFLALYSNKNSNIAAPELYSFPHSSDMVYPHGQGWRKCSSWIRIRQIGIMSKWSFGMLAGGRGGGVIAPFQSNIQ